MGETPLLFGDAGRDCLWCNRGYGPSSTSPSHKGLNPCGKESDITDRVRMCPCLSDSTHTIARTVASIEECSHKIKIQTSQTKHGGIWDVDGLGFYDSNNTKLSTYDVFDSNHHEDSPLYAPERAFDGKSHWWGGRKKDGIFYIGASIDGGAINHILLKHPKDTNQALNIDVWGWNPTQNVWIKIGAKSNAQAKEVEILLPYCQLVDDTSRPAPTTTTITTATRTTRTKTKTTTTATITTTTTTTTTITATTTTTTTTSTTTTSTTTTTTTTIPNNTNGTAGDGGDIRFDTPTGPTPTATTAAPPTANTTVGISGTSSNISFDSSTDNTSSQPSSGLHAGIVVGILLVVVAAVFGIAVCFCTDWCKRKDNETQAAREEFQEDDARRNTVSMVINPLAERKKAALAAANAAPHTTTASAPVAAPKIPATTTTTVVAFTVNPTFVGTGDRPEQSAVHNQNGGIHAAFNPNQPAAVYVNTVLEHSRVVDVAHAQQQQPAIKHTSEPDTPNTPHSTPRQQRPTDRANALAAVQLPSVAAVQRPVLRARASAAAAAAAQDEAGCMQTTDGHASTDIASISTNTGTSRKANNNTSNSDAASTSTNNADQDGVVYFLPDPNQQAVYLEAKSKVQAEYAEVADVRSAVVLTKDAEDYVEDYFVNSQSSSAAGSAVYAVPTALAEHPTGSEAQGHPQEVHEESDDGGTVAVVALVPPLHRPVAAGDYVNMVLSGPSQDRGKTTAVPPLHLHTADEYAVVNKLPAAMTYGGVDSAEYSNVPADGNDLNAEEKYETIGKHFTGFGSVDNDDGKYATLDNYPTLDKNGDNEDTFC